MLLLWLCFIFIFLITTLSWLMLCCLADGLWCSSGLSLDFFLHCSLKWSKMLQFLHFFLPNAGQLSFLRSRHGCLPGPFFPQFLHLSWAETLSWTLLTWLLESPPLNIFREVFPVSPQRGVQAQVTERLHNAARPIKRAANCRTGSSLSCLLTSEFVCLRFCSASPQPAS